MKGDTRVIAVLNQSLQEELTAINQYIVHSEMCSRWGYDKLAATIKKEAIEEMGHAEHLIERILFLEGVPSLGNALPFAIGATVKDQLANDLKAETRAVASYNKASQLARDAGDNGSEDLFESHLKDEERHANFIEGQLHLIQEMGYENYLTQLVSGA